jgi:hypothetical protein
MMNRNHRPKKGLISILPVLRTTSWRMNQYTLITKCHLLRRG